MSASKDTIYLVVVRYSQSAYTEPRYWAAAKDATDIYGAFRNQAKAEAYAKRIYEHLGIDEYDPEEEVVPEISVVPVSLMKSGKTAPIGQILV